MLPFLQGTYLGSVSALSLFEKFAKILFRRISSEIALSCRISTPRQGVRDISIRRGVGCLFRLGRLAMPQFK